MEAIEKEVLNALSEVYISIFAYDLEKDEMYAIKSNPLIDQLIGIPGTLQDKMNNVMSRIAVPEHVKMILEFTCLETLPERMQGKRILSTVFEGRMNGWCKARFLRIGADTEAAVRYVLYVVECIDEEKRQENRLRQLAQSDLLTGISNRGYGEQCIEAAMKAKKPGMFILFDVDKFKRINDVYGHGAGDQVLIAIAAAMQKVKTEHDVIMRLGGDEFAAYFAGVEDQQRGCEVIGALLREIASIRIEPIREEISVSLGAVLYEEGLDFYQAYRRADKGVYESKLNKGSSYIFRV